jgi:ABC-type glycerol-3-phosphate transport system permease component
LKKIKRKNGAIKEGFSPLTIVMAVILGMYCLILAIWLVWALLTSLKNPNDFLGNKYGLPNPWYFDNFAYVIYEYKVEKLIDGVSTVISTGDMILNSVLYSVGSAFVATLVPCITAYLCARYKYKFSKIIYSTVLVCMVIPIVGSQASELQIVIKMGIYDHMFGMWILKSGFLGLYFLVFHEVFLSIPNAYGEAAEIDGASDFCIMTKISLPLAKNTFFTVLLIMFVTYWNDFQTPMLYLPTHPTISEALYWIKSSSFNYFAKMPVKMAAPMMFLLPVLIIFLCFHKRLLGNLTVGGVKG